jgi:tetratricopeptide (TPR) repeat protein
VVELAAGNPLYAEEYVRMLQDLALLKRVGRTWQLDTEQEIPLPDTIQGLVAARIDALGATEKDLVRDAAVVGKVFWPSAAAAIGLREKRELAALLHALERKEFIRRERRSAVARETQYAFLHAIVREVAYRQIPRAGRAEKHRAVAAWIEQLAPDRSADRVEMLAHHYHQALELSRAAGGELDALIPAARSALAQASERAETLHAWPAARELAASALDLTEAGDPARPVLAVRMTRAEMNLSDFDPDRAAAARELCLEQGDFEHGAEAESLRGLMLWQRGAREAALAAYERSVELVAGLPDSPSKLHVLAARARLAAIMHDLETALRLVEEALGPAERLGRDDYLSSLLNTRGLARANAGQPGGVEDLRRAVEVAERSQEAWSLLQAHNNLAQLLWQTGRIEEGAEQLAAYDRTVERFGMQFQLGWLDAQKVYLAYLRGDYGELIDGG